MMKFDAGANATSIAFETGASLSYLVFPWAEIVVSPFMTISSDGLTPGFRTGVRIPFGSPEDCDRSDDENQRWQPVGDDVIQISDREQGNKYCECGSVAGRFIIQKGRFDPKDRIINLEQETTTKEFDKKMDGRNATITFDQDQMNEGDIQMISLVPDENDATCDCVEYDEKLIEKLEEVERIEG